MEYPSGQCRVANVDQDDADIADFLAKSRGGNLPIIRDIRQNTVQLQTIV